MRRSRASILAGDQRGRRLAIPDGIRPTGARLREALFSIWQERIEGSRFLDLFAGAGLVGLEAVSRGAGAVVLVEWDRRVAATLQANVALAGRGRARVVRMRLPDDLARWAQDGTEPFDLVFADPPYRFADHAALLTAAVPLLARGASVALEHAARVETPRAVAGMKLRDVRTYGDSALSFFALEPTP